MIEESDPPLAEVDAPEDAKPTGSWIAQWLVPIILFSSFSFFYLSTHTRWYTFDSVAYATRIRQYRDVPKASYLVHPHHLLFNSVGYGFWTLLDAIGIHVSSLQALQIMNSLVGSLLLAVFYLMLLRRGFRWRGPPVVINRQPLVEACATVALGCSFGFWAISTDGRVNAPALLCLTLAIGFAWGAIDNPTVGQAVTCAAMTVLAVGFHQSHGLIVAFGAACMLLCLAPLRRRLILAGTYLGGSIAGIGLLYSLFGFVVLGYRTLGEVIHWALIYSEDGRWWKLDFINNLVELDDKAYTQSFVASPPLPSEGGIYGWQSDLLHDVRSLALPLMSVLAGIALLCIVWGIVKDRGGEGWRKQASIFALVLPYVAFFTIWDPGYWVFWIPVTIGTFGLLAILPWRAPLWARSVFAGLFLAWGVACLIANASASFLRRARLENNLDLVATMKLGKVAGPHDIMLVTGMGEAAKFEVYVPYFAGANVSVAHMELKRAGADFARARDTIRRKIADTLARGDRVFIAREYYSQGQWGQVGKRYNLPPDAKEQILTGYDRVELNIGSPVRLFYLRPLGKPPPKDAPRSKPPIHGLW